MSNSRGRRNGNKGKHTKKQANNTAQKEHLNTDPTKPEESFMAEKPIDASENPGDLKEISHGDVKNIQANQTRSKPMESAELKRKRRKRIYRWLIFGVFASCSPVLLSIIFDCLVGFNFSYDKMKYFSDCLLLVVAVAANAWSYALDGVERDGCLLIAICSFVFGLSLYSFLYKAQKAVIDDSVNILFLVCIVLLIANALVGVWIEYHPPTQAHGKDKEVN